MNLKEIKEQPVENKDTSSWRKFKFDFVHDEKRYTKTFEAFVDGKTGDKLCKDIISELSKSKMQCERFTQVFYYIFEQNKVKIKDFKENVEIFTRKDSGRDHIVVGYSSSNSEFLYKSQPFFEESVDYDYCYSIMMEGCWHDELGDPYYDASYVLFRSRKNYKEEMQEDEWWSAFTYNLIHQITSWDGYEDSIWGEFTIHGGYAHLEQEDGKTKVDFHVSEDPWHEETGSDVAILPLTISQLQYFYTLSEGLGVLAKIEEITSRQDVEKLVTNVQHKKRKEDGSMYFCR